MMRYSIQPKDYGFLSFGKNMRKYLCKNISTKLSGKNSQKPLDHAKQSATDEFKTASKRAIKKTAEATDILIGNKITDAVPKSYDGRLTKLSKNSQQNNSEIVTNENDKEIPKERYISPKKKDNKSLMN